MNVCPQFIFRFGKDDEVATLSGDDNAAEVISGDEVFDLIAEAAKVSAHAARAYALMREANPAILTLAARQRLITGRMQETTL